MLMGAWTIASPWMASGNANIAKVIANNACVGALILASGLSLVAYFTTTIREEFERSQQLDVNHRLDSSPR